MNECAPDKCKLRVNLKGESQDVSFEQPVDSVEFSDGKCTRPHLPILRFPAGVTAGIAIASISIYAWFSVKNIGTYKKDSHQVISREGVMMLDQQGIGWNEEKRMWDSVTKLSPELPSPLE